MIPDRDSSHNKGRAACKVFSLRLLLVLAVLAVLALEPAALPHAITDSVQRLKSRGRRR